MRNVRLLNADWLFLKDAVAAEEIAAIGDDRFTAVNIPHTWNGIDGQDGGDDYHRGLCWYKKCFEHPWPSDGRCYLEFEAVNSVANVYVNGRHLGEHRGGYSAFRFDITDVLVPGQNTLIVSADNAHYEDVFPLFADFTFYGGIYRDVRLIETSPIHFDLLDYGSDGVYITPRRITDAAAELEIRSLLRNAGAPAEVTLQAELVDVDGRCVTGGSTGVTLESVDVDGPGTESVIFLKIDNPVLWDGVRNPYLYECRVAILHNGCVSDSVSIPVGLRFFNFDGDKGFFLNGKPTRLNGVSRHQDREGVGNALTREHQIEDMDLIREVGANSIRLAHYQHSRFFYDLCDRAGMVVWAEIPYISRTSTTDPSAANAVNQMKELVKQNYNHPSIVLWGVQNEIGIFADETRPLHEVVREMNAVVKAIDTTRATTQAQVMMVAEDDPANYETDVVAFNQYHGWYVGDTSGYADFINRFRKANPHKCLGYSEYGAEGILKWHSDNPKVKDYTEEYHALYHEQVMATFNACGFLWGTYVWNMFDFGSDMRDEGGIQGRNNKGLVTFDRKTRKDAFFFYKSIWNREPMVHIASKRFVDRHTPVIDVLIYSNQREVILIHNDHEIGRCTSDSTVFSFEITLAEGENTITARAGDLSDTAVFRKVAEPNPAYMLPPEETKKGIMDFGDDEHIKNWFDDASAEAPGELQFPEGYFSIKDRIKDILANAEGRGVLETWFPGMLEHPRMKMAKGMPFEMIINFKPDAFPRALIYKVNCELNRIRK